SALAIQIYKQQPPRRSINLATPGLPRFTWYGRRGQVTPKTDGYSLNDQQRKKLLALYEHCEKPVLDGIRWCRIGASGLLSEDELREFESQKTRVAKDLEKEANVGNASA
ncbi:hypothetical protein, partial [Ramlibacter sp.]|uniref:hypothetical protein n=1 Tax=Ramlibacter sp. TaxID=1917967 RepID=UPI0025E0B098